MIQSFVQKWEGKFQKFVIISVQGGWGVRVRNGHFQYISYLF